MKRFLIILGMVIGIALNGYAQNDKSNRSFDEWQKEAFGEYENFRSRSSEEFEKFRRKAIKDYIDFVNNPWKKFKESKPIPRPKDDILPVVKPKDDKQQDSIVPPVVKPKEDKQQDSIVPPVVKPKEENVVIIEDVIPHLPIEPQPQPIVPIEEVPVKKEKYLEFAIFGTEERVRFNNNNPIELNPIREGNVAKMLKRLSDEKNDNTLVDCLNIRSKLQLCDWAYLMMLKAIGEAAYGAGTNEATLLIAYLYMQSGYRMRLGSYGNKLYMLYASKHCIFDIPSYIIDEDYYYCLEKTPPYLNISVAKYPNEKSLSLIINEEPLFAMDTTKLMMHSSKKSDLSVSIKSNKNMLNFYTSYPTSMLGSNYVSRWAMYANIPMPKYIASQVYPQIKEAIKELDQIAAVNSILNWVQTGFIYEYDDTIWGHDRAFFPEESLYYPYCDCEDRAIMLTRILRDVLNLNCILIYYPNHLAAGVEITEGTPTGDYIEYDGHRYFVIDGTILYGADLGVTMLGMDNGSATIIVLK